jgi:phage shock protein A
MPEVVERVAKLEEQFDAVSRSLTRVENRLEARMDRLEARLDAGLAEVKESVVRVEGRLDAGLAEVRQSLSRVENKVDTGMTGLSEEMQSQFRWIIGGIGSTVLAIILAVISQIIFGN